MTRIEYIGLLKVSLQHLPLDELKDILSDYEEHFDIGISKGKSEEEISSELGHPKEVASNYRTSYRSNFNDNDYNHGTVENNIARKILIALALLFFNIVFIFGPLMGLVGLLIGLYGASIGFLFGGIGMLFNSPLIHYGPFLAPGLLTSISFGIALGGLGILIGILSVYLTKLFYTLIVKYVKWNLELINK